MLKEYNKKRDFKQTSEPTGAKKSSGSDRLAFVIQRHDATRLHYDFRLELNGVLKSWAVPKGPSLNPKDKRLAVMVEDHPFKYKNFYGSIPEGNYGAGEVEIWDEGFYFPVNEEHEKISQAQAIKNLDKGELKVLMAGSQLKGEFVLVRLKQDDKNWLLIKHKDDYSTEDEYNIESVASIKQKKARTTKKTARAKAKVISEKTKAAPKKVKGASVKKKATPPVKKFKPMLAHIASTPFDDKDWVYEIKWDGYRAIASKTGDDVQLWSRNELSFNNKFPAIVEAIAESIDHDTVLDGEVIALVNGRSSFQALQHAEDTKPLLRYCIFDLLYLDGESVMDLPLTDRKKLLQNLLEKSSNKTLEYTPHIEGNGISFYKKITGKGHEGIMAKKADSNYTPGTRSRQWLKIKNRNDKEAIIVGYTKGTGSRKYFGALILAEKTGNTYRYMGHTGTGFDERTLKELYEKMQPLVTGKSPFETKIKVNAPVTWIKPKLVCTIYFTEETEAGQLRHPVFAGLRIDKSAKEITPMEKAIEPKGNQSLVIDKKEVAVTNPDKIYFPEKGITKGDVIAYYHSISKYILPHLKNRPLSLKRNPNGIHGESFFHKNAGENVPGYVKTFETFSESSNRNIEYIICNNAPTLIYLANLGCIEMNPWNSTYQKTDNPTYIIIDIDPSEGNSFEQVIETARAVKEVTDKAGLTSYCKTSGASGLHVYIPFGGRYNYDTLKNFAEMLAVFTHELVPGFTSLERNLKKRGKKIYVDFLQNRRGQTLASAYSLRPVPDASVSTPLDWKEVKKGLHPSQFDIFNIQKRVEKKGDLFIDVLTAKNDLRKAMKLLNPSIGS